MKSPLSEFAWKLLIVGLILLLLGYAFGAPAPFYREAPRPRPLSETLPGEWKMYWGGTPFRTTLERGGGYRARLGGLEWVGSWTVDGQGRFRIIESTRPEDADSWRSYCVPFEPGTLHGHEEQSKVEIRLERFKE